jgi:hypothetical protein
MRIVISADVAGPARKRQRIRDIGLTGASGQLAVHNDF